MKIINVYVCSKHNRALNPATGEWHGSELPDCTDNYQPGTEVAFNFLEQECDYCSAGIPHSHNNGHDWNVSYGGTA